MPQSRSFSLLERGVIKFRQTIYRKSISLPFLSGDAFASIADLVIRDKGDLKTLSSYSKKLEILFCRSDLVPQIKNFMPMNVKCTVLMAGNSDYDFLSRNELPLSNFRYFFLQNSFISDGLNIHSLPIGIENLRIGINGLPKYFNKGFARKTSNEKVLVGPFSPTNIERSELIDVASFDRSTFEVVAKYCSPKSYAQLSGQYRFIACPRGNGVDTHRFWEALYRGSIPIVKASEWSRGLESLGITYIQVEDWSETKLEIKKFIEQGLDSSANDSALWFPWWEEKIRGSK